MLTIIIKDISNYSRAAIQVENGTELYDVLKRNNCLESTDEDMVNKNKQLCVKWFHDLEMGLAVVNPNYLKVAMLVAPEKTVLIHTEDNCASCGQPLPTP